MIVTSCRIALKEWAVTVNALGRGEQVLLLRKGGIREEGREFRVSYPEFLLYPTFEHQREDLLKERYSGDLRRVLSEAQPQDAVGFSYWARVEDVVELTEQEKVDALSPHYIWTTDYAQQRLHWKPRHPLSALILRVYRLEEPRTLPYLPIFGGCKSWVELSEGVALGTPTPVLTDGQFNDMVAGIRVSLEL